MPRANLKQPETMAQAKRWEKVNQRYLKKGLCVKCASQASWGHQLGFKNVEHDPCETCRPIIDSFPVEHRMNTAWRSMRFQDAVLAQPIRKKALVLA